MIETSFFAAEGTVVTGMDAVHGQLFQSAQRSGVKLGIGMIDRVEEGAVVDDVAAEQNARVLLVERD